jgi:hypothetical protein
VCESSCCKCCCCHFAGTTAGGCLTFSGLPHFRGRVIKALLLLATLAASTALADLPFVSSYSAGTTAGGCQASVACPTSGASSSRHCYFLAALVASTALADLPFVSCHSAVNAAGGCQASVVCRSAGAASSRHWQWTLRGSARCSHATWRQHHCHQPWQHAQHRCVLVYSGVDQTAVLHSTRVWRCTRIPQ